MILNATYTINIFIAYHEADQKKLDELRLHLAELNEKNKGYLINKIAVDNTKVNWESTKELLAGADLILLLMSSHSVLSPLFVSDALRQTLVQHEEKDSIVVPIILNTCWWEDTVFKKLDVLPKAGLPIYDSTDVKNELYDQVIDGLGTKLIKIKEYKKELENLFAQKVISANNIFKKWQEKPETLRSALSLFQDAKKYWRDGFSPDKKQIEAYIDICFREIDFNHYAKAAHEAYRAGDLQTCYFNCKDALGLRNDAVVRKLFKELSEQIDATKLAKTKEPFERYLKKAQAYFLTLEWKKAQVNFKLAVEKHQKEFSPTIQVIEHKIEICEREFILANSFDKAQKMYASQQYQRMADVLMTGIREINNKALGRIEYALKLIADLNIAEAYRDHQLNKWGFRNKTNGQVIIAPKYIAAYNFTENLAGVKKWDKWGFIDVEGNEIIPFHYDYVTSFQNGIAQVILKNETWCINHKAERVAADIIMKEVPITDDDK